MKRILWLQPQGFTGGLRALAHAQMRQVSLPMQVMYEYTLPNKWKTYTGKKKWIANPANKAAFFALVAKHQPDLVIVNSDIALSYLTDNKHQSLAMTRGSVYQAGGLPWIVIDNIHKFHKLKWMPWVFRKDFEKIKRWTHGQRRAEPRFTYQVCRTLDDVAGLQDVIYRRALLVSVDIETTGVGRNAQISSISYTVWEKDGTVRSWVIPLVYAVGERRRFWESEADELSLWNLLQSINDSPVAKVMQNGSYDSCYFIRYRIPLRNYILDTAHIFHSLWPEARKRLDFIASIAVDNYRFWKDEAKEDDKDDNKKLKLPTSEAGYESYWRYNALDTHYTLLSCQWLLGVLMARHNRWALTNYLEEMNQVLGPALAMTMRGVRVNPKLQLEYFQENMEESDEALARLRVMVDDADYNPNSPPQTQRIIYDICRATPLPRKGRTTDEKVLNIIRTQSPILDIIIRQLWAAKKPANNASKYGAKLQLFNGRWMYVMNAGGTETGRYSSKAHNFWIGTQIQNPPHNIRTMVEADDGYYLVKIDYGKSDAWFTAHESQNPNLLAVITGDKDAHCLHAAQFFQRDYQELQTANEKGEAWCTHNVTGLRSIAKRIGYGANYLMAGYTLFITMGYEAVVAAAKALGYANADSWSLDQLIELCQMLLDKYFDKLYPGLKDWIYAEVRATAARGNKATCYGGRTRTFFGDLAKDKNVQRELAAFYGQGGTAGNINKALKNLYWVSDCESRGLVLLYQVHDEINFLVPKNNLELVGEVKQIMETPCELHGRRFIVPAEPKIGKGWGKRMLKWHPGITAKEIEDHDRQWWNKRAEESNPRERKLAVAGGA